GSGITSITDYIDVEGHVFLDGKIQVQVLTENEQVEQGCYLIANFGDSLGVSQEYVKNFVLTQQRYGDNYYALDFSEPGKVYLCVTKMPYPVIQRSIDLPLVEGVTTDPIAGRYYVRGHNNFDFTSQFTGSPLKVWALGYYSSEHLDLDATSVSLGGGLYRYEIVQVVEPWTVYIGPEERSVDSDGIENGRIWTYGNTLYINVPKADIASIYNMTGVLYKKVEIPEGLNRFTLERGVYTVTLKNGEVHMIIVK
ncbi:MAG: hypothetical protein LBT42_05555, partial [Tannerella sp.]|nr:hypothetical protein [Tannerella sp.]